MTAPQSVLNSVENSASPMGSVFTLRVRCEAQGEDEFVPGGDEGVDQNRHDPRQRQGQDDPEQDSDAARAIDDGCLVQFTGDGPEVARQHPHAERQGNDHVDEDETPVGVHQAQHFQRDEERHDDRRCRQELPDKNAGLPERLTPEPEAGEAVCREYGENESKACRAYRDDDGVEEVARDAALEENLIIIC